MAETALAQLASSGVLGAFLVLCLFALRAKDNALREESKGRLEDAVRFLGIATAMQKDVITAVAALTDIIKKWEKREEEQERLEREIDSRNR